MTGKRHEKFVRQMETGVKLGVAAALREHVRDGMPIVISRGGEISVIPSEEIPARALYPRIEGYPIQEYPVGGMSPPPFVNED